MDAHGSGHANANALDLNPVIQRADRAMEILDSFIEKCSHTSTPRGAKSVRTSKHSQDDDGAASAAPTASMSPYWNDSPPSAKQILEALGQQGAAKHRKSQNNFPIMEEHGCNQSGIYLVTLSPSEAATLKTQSRLLLQVSHPSRDHRTQHEEGAHAARGRSHNNSALGSLSNDPFWSDLDADGLPGSDGTRFGNWSRSNSVSPLLLPRNTSLRSPTHISRQHSREEISGMLTSEEFLGQHLQQSGISSMQTAFISWKFLLRRYASCFSRWRGVSLSQKPRHAIKTNTAERGRGEGG